MRRTARVVQVMNLTKRAKIEEGGSWIYRSLKKSHDTHYRCLNLISRDSAVTDLEGDLGMRSFKAPTSWELISQLRLKITARSKIWLENVLVCTIPTEI